MTNQLSPREWESLSAYLDGQLSPKELRNLETQLQTRADLRAGLEELRRTRAIVRAHLPMRAPRNFMLSPEMAGVSAPRLQLGGWFPALRLSSALSSLLFLFVVVGDMLFSRGVAVPMMLAEEMALQSAAPVTESVGEALPEAPVALEAEPAAQPAPKEIAKALEAASPTLEAPLPAMEVMVLTETVTGPPQDVGLGGGGGGEVQQDQAALSAMAPAPTATPLPTPTLTPTPTPEATPTQLAELPRERGVQPAHRLAWRWLEIILAMVGVTTGLIAFYLYRTGRS